MKKREKYPESKAENADTNYEEVYAGPEMPDGEEPVVTEEKPEAPDNMPIEKPAYAGPAMLVYGGPEMMVYGGPDYFRNRGGGMIGFAGLDLSNQAQKPEESAKTEEAGQKAKFCRECGAKILPGAKFCIECGTKVE